MRMQGGGIKEERVILYQLLQQRGCTGRWLDNFLQGYVETGRWRALLKTKKGLDVASVERFQERLALQPRLLERLALMETAFARVDGKAAEEARPEAYRLIGALRNLLAQVCIDAVQPDLIILDEFQRFKDLLTTGDTEPSPEAELARQLFSYRTPEKQRVALLLLSATPYRMFTTSEESASEDHYQDFLQTLQFLLDDEARFSDLQAAVRGYRDELIRAGTGDEHHIRNIRDQLQSQLLRVMCRRERVGSTEDRDSMVCERRPAAPLDPSDIERYLALERLREHLEGSDLIELWKSAPYLLNFAKNYEFKRSFDERCGHQALCDAFSKHAAAHLSSERIAEFAAIDPGNARLRALAHETIENDQWQMLWLPPSLPYWPLRGAWAKNRHFTKKLLFSSWNVVPDAVSALLSYEVERRSAGAVESGATPYQDFYRKRSPLLRFAVAEGKAASMTTLALQLPCLRLAALHPLTLRIGESDDVRGALRPAIEALVSPLQRYVRSSGSDPAWYWAALLLLDEPASDVAQFLRWLELNHASTRRGAVPETADGLEVERLELPPGATTLSLHIRRALDVLQGDVELGDFPPDLVDVLVDFTLGSPAILWARTLGGFGIEDSVRRQLAATLAEAFRSLFNQPPVSRMLQRGDAAKYWQSTLHYAVDGNLQAVLDEYAHLLWEPAAFAPSHPNEIAREVTKNAAAALTTKTSTIHPDYYRAAADRILASDGAALRTHFALRYGGVRSKDEAQSDREDTVRDAFKSPFYPFVLASTSVGQEGLDFHPWCHSVWHWNLPGNPVDLEQREGRVHRYKGHAVRKNVAERHGQELAASWKRGMDPWAVLFELAERARAPGESELVPCWLAPGSHKVERVVPMTALSREQGELERLKRSLAIYRVVFGQPRQGELVELLRGAAFSIEKLDSWVVRLEPVPDRR